jgi:uncharacterized protein (TIRG00374 family)
MNARQIGSLALKLVITVGLLWLLASKIDVSAVVAQLRSIEPRWAVAAIMLMFGQLLLTGIRWYIVGRLVSAAVGLGQAVRLVLIGQFFNQVLPTPVGGDAVRAWLLFRETAPLVPAVVSIICDRVAALVVLIVIVAVTLPLLSYAGLHAPVLEKLAVIASVLTVSGLFFLLFLGEAISETFQRKRLFRPVGILVGNMRTVLFTSVNSILVSALALLVQVIMVLVIVVCAMAMGIHLRAVHVLLLPLILLVSMFPISFAGWGVRESAMVAGLGFAGISAPEALAISLLFGLTQIVIGVPGGVMWLLRRGDQTGNASRSQADTGGGRTEGPGAT